jgi:hypothetical protein
VKNVSELQSYVERWLRHSPISKVMEAKCWSPTTWTKSILVSETGIASNKKQGSSDGHPGLSGIL